MIQSSKDRRRQSSPDTPTRGCARPDQSARTAGGMAEARAAQGDVESDDQESDHETLEVNEVRFDNCYFNEEFGSEEDVDEIVSAAEQDADEDGPELNLSAPEVSCHVLEDPIHVYLTEIGKYPLLTKDEESEIAVDIRYWRTRLADALFKSDFVAQRAVSLIRSLTESKAESEVSQDDDLERMDALFMFKRDGSDGKGGVLGTRKRLEACARTIEHLLKRIQDAVPKMYDASLSSQVRFEEAQSVFRIRKKIATLLHETGMRRPLLNRLKTDFLTAGKDLPDSAPGESALQLFGESATRLARRAAVVQQCDEQYEGARTKLCKHNLRLVVSNAKSFVSREKSWAAKSEELLERIQAGNEGLLVGVDGFDNDLGFKFSTYATHWIKQRQGRDQYESGQSLQRKVSSQTLVNQVRRSLEKFSREYHREPDEYDLAEFSGIPVEKVRLGLRLMRSNISLDAEMGARDKDSRMTLGDMLAAREEESAASVLDREWVRKLTHPDAKILEERESLVVRLRFGIFSDEERTAMSQQYGVDLREPLTLQQVGRILGVTRERIRQIESRAIGKLRDVLERRGDLS